MNKDIQEYKNSGVKVIVISPESLEKTLEFFKFAKFEPNFTTVLDPDREILKKYFVIKKEDNSIIPSVFLIDKEGKIQFKHYAQHTADRPPKDYILKAIKSFLD